MDSIQRLIRFALFCALLAMAAAWSDARAAGTVSGGSGSGQWCVSIAFGSSASCGTPTPTLYTDSGSALAGQLAILRAANGTCDWVGSITSQTATAAAFRYTSVPGCATATQSATLGSTCPSNAALSGGTCTCNTGYAPNAGATACAAVGSSSCQTLVDAMNGAAARPQVANGSTVAGVLELCTGGCLVGADGSVRGPTMTTWAGPFVLVSSTCTAGPTAPSTSDAPISCVAGQAPGVVNGLNVCVPATTTTTKDSSVTTAPSGAASAPAGTIPGSESRVTTCSQGNCNTVTTTKDAAGNVLATKTDEKTKNSFCQDNPDTTICKASSFSATCGATASAACDGDAIQCAIAKEEHRRNCLIFDQTGATKTLGDDAIARGDTKASDHPGAAGNIVTTSVGSSQDMTDLIGGSCFADETVTITAGTTVVMPWSKLCTPAGWLGNVLVGLTSLAWIFIAFKRD